MKRTPGFLWLAIVSAALLSGCKALAVATTAVKPDGSWTRTVRFRGEQNLPALEDHFALPRGEPWQTRKEWRPGEATYIARRRLHPGEVLDHDLVVTATDASSPPQLLINQVTVRPIEPGRLEYREVLRWQGPRPEPLINPERRFVHLLQSVLPTGVSTEAETAAVARTVLHELWRDWFGPGLALYANEQDDLANRRIKRQLGIAVDTALREKLGERLTPAQRLAAARQWVALILKASQGDTRGEQKTGPLGLQDLRLDPLLFSVWLPGKVISTNGEVDAVSGEVFWGLYAEAAASEDVVLTATCDLNPVSAKMATRNRQR